MLLPNVPFPKPYWLFCSEGDLQHSLRTPHLSLVAYRALCNTGKVAIFKSEVFSHFLFLQVSVPLVVDSLELIIAS